MKRFHIHIGVEKLDESIRFYSALFGADPVKRKPDYAKWSLEDPRVNFRDIHASKEEWHGSPGHSSRGRNRTEGVARTSEGC